VRVNRRARTVQAIATGIEHPAGLALTGDGRRLYIAADFQGLRVVDLHTGAVTDVPTVKCPIEVVTIPNRDLLYVGYQCGGPGGRDGHDAIDVRTASTGALITTIVGPPQVSTDLVVSPDGAQVWIDGHDACSAPRYDHANCPLVPGGVLHAYRTDDHLKLATFGMPHAEGPEGLSFAADSSRLLVAGTRSRVFDTTRMALIERSARGTVSQVVFTPDGRRAYAIATGRKKLGIYELATDACQQPPAGLVAWWSGDGHPGDIHRDSNGDSVGGAE
jgi:sugar lactone lactonase YvrE